MAKLKLKKQRRFRANKSAVIDKKVIIIAAIVLAVVVVSALITILALTGNQNNETDIAGIEIKQLPKTSYIIGEAASYDGLMVEVVLMNGERYDIDLDECTIEGFSTESATDFCTIRIYYQGFSCAYNISVKEPPEKFVELVSVEFKTLPYKLTYKVGEWVEPFGGVLLCTYSDGSTKEVALGYEHIMNFNSNNVGEYTIRVKYTEGVYVANTQYTVTITE